MAKKVLKSFPMLPVAHWWSLRGRFKQSLPGVVTADYRASTLNIKPESAQGNVIPSLRDMGFIDEEGKTLELAKAWRDDEQYQKVCTKIRDALYPEDLLAAVPNPSEDRAAVERWFANESGSGAVGVKRMTAIYLIIAEADISKTPNKKRDNKAKIAKPRIKPKVTKKSTVHTPPASPPPITPQAPPPAAPGLNINLEIHISSDATPDQIDKIFESMAKHIYRK